MSPTSSSRVTGKWITYAILALAIDLAWGYAGILSLGHGAFFALGGYAIGMHLMRLIGPRGVYGHPMLPDFMVFLGYRELPWYWLGFDSFPFAHADGAAGAGRCWRWCVGFLAFRSRITGVYLSIITQAMTYALMLAFFRNDMGFGGNNGFTDFKELLGMPLNTADRAGGAVLRLARRAARLACCICAASTASKLGRVLVAIRDAESRVRFLGYDVTQHKLFAFVLSAMLAGLAGALYVPQVGIINPGEFSPGNSIEAVIWVAVGGRGTLVGAVLGAFSVNALKTWLTTRGAGPLAVRAGRAVRRGHAVPAARPGRPAAKARDADSERRAGPLPRRRLGRLRRLPGAEQPVPDRRAGRAARRHRPERRRQDHDDGRHHRQDPADRRRPSRFREHDLTRLDEATIANLGIGRKFQKPTVFDALTVFENLELALKAPRGPIACLRWVADRRGAPHASRRRWTRSA